MADFIFILNCVRSFPMAGPVPTISVLLGLYHSARHHVPRAHHLTRQ